MSTPLIGVIASSAFVALLLLLIRFEAQKGVRMVRGFREALDRAVLRARAVRRRLSSYIGRKMFRQTLHFFFHQCLSAVLRFLRSAETRIAHLLRINRSFARRIESSGNGTNSTKNKLHEIAEHKQETALTDAEKKQRKRKSLEG